MKTLHNLACRLFGFTIIGSGYKKRHYTLRYSEATQWAACYADGAVVYRKGLPVASKNIAF